MERRAAAQAIRARISGRIQGVGFRTHVLACARRLELAGWLRQLPGGVLELHAEGEPARLDELRAALASSSYVLAPSIEIEHAAPEGLVGFELRS